MTAFLQTAMTAAAGTPVAATLEEHWSEAEGRQGAGLGWAVTRREGERMLWHNGLTGGYYAFVGFLPERQRGLVMLTNARHAGDAFAVSLLRGEQALPELERDWFLLGLTLFFVAYAPVVAYSFRARALATLTGVAKPRWAASTYQLQLSMRHPCWY